MVDRRIIPDLRWIAQRFPIYVTDGYSGPLPNGEHAGCNDCHVKNSDHYNGLAVDIVPLEPKLQMRRQLGRDHPPRPLGRAGPEQTAAALPLGRLRRRRRPRLRPPPPPLLEPRDRADVPARRMGRSLPGRPATETEPVAPKKPPSRARKPRPARPAASPRCRPAASRPGSATERARATFPVISDPESDTPWSVHRMRGCVPGSRLRLACLGAGRSPAAAAGTTRRRSPAWKAPRPTCRRSTAAPGAVRLGGETPISECLAENQSAGDLARVGEAMLEAATDAERRGAGRPGRRRRPPARLPARRRRARRRGDRRHPLRPGPPADRRRPLRPGREPLSPPSSAYAAASTPATRAASRTRRGTTRPRGDRPNTLPRQRTSMEAHLTEQLWGGETTKAVDNFPVSGERVPVPVVRWLGRIKAAAAEANGALGLLDADLAERIAERRQGGRRRRARRPVPGRRLPDRLRHLLEHERQRGDRQPRRRGRPTPTTTSTWASPPTTSSPPPCTWRRWTR